MSYDVTSWSVSQFDGLSHSKIREGVLVSIFACRFWTSPGNKSMKWEIQKYNTYNHKLQCSWNLGDKCHTYSVKVIWSRLFMHLFTTFQLTNKSRDCLPLSHIIIILCSYFKAISGVCSETWLPVDDYAVCGPIHKDFLIVLSSTWLEAYVIPVDVWS